MIKELESKGWFSLVTLIVSAIALIVSVKSCRDAKNAVTISQRQFLEENRPHLLIEPVEFKDTGGSSYLKIDRNDDVVKVHVKYRLTNIGNSIAKDIISPTKAIVEGFGGQEALMSKVSPISLGPGQKINVVLWILLKKKGEKSVDDFVNESSSGKANLTHEFPTEYSTDLDPSIHYYTIVEHKIFSDHAEIMRSEMISSDRNKRLEGRT